MPRKSPILSGALADIAPVLALALAVSTPASAAEQPAPDLAYASAAGLQALAAQVAATLKPGQPAASATALRLAPYKANVEVRVGVGAATVHETEAEFFVVLEGAGELQTGGKLIAETRSSPHDLRGSGLDGGVPHTIAKGDILVVPENTPHWFSRIDGKLVLLSLHVPRGAK